MHFEKILAIRSTKKIAIAIPFVLFTILISFFFIGTYSMDGAANIFIAYDISSGHPVNFNIDQTYSLFRYIKLVVIYSYVLVFKIFGVNQITTVLISIIAGYFNVLFVYLISMLYLDKKTAILAASLTATLPVVIFFSTISLQEIVYSALLLASIYFFLKAVKSEKRIFFYFFLSGALLGINLYVREHSVFNLIFIPIYFGLFPKKFNKNVLGLIVGYLAVFIIGNGIIYLQSGNFFYQLSLASKRFGGTIYPERNKFFDNIAHPFYYTYAIFTRITNVGIIPISTVFLLLWSKIKRTSLMKIRDILIILLSVFIAHEFLYRMILPAPNTIAYIVPIFPLITILMAFLIINTDIKIKTNYIKIFLIVTSLIFLYLIIFDGINVIQFVVAKVKPNLYNLYIESNLDYVKFIYEISLIILVVCLVFLFGMIYLTKKSEIIKANSGKILIVFILIASSIGIFIPLNTKYAIKKVSVYKECYNFIEKSRISPIYILDYHQATLPRIFSKLKDKVIVLSKYSQVQKIKFIVIDIPVSYDSLKGKYILLDETIESLLSQENNSLKNTAVYKEIHKQAKVLYEKGKLKLYQVI